MKYQISFLEKFYRHQSFQQIQQMVQHVNVFDPELRNE
jgi:hypothetical protein